MGIVTSEKGWLVEWIDFLKGKRRCLRGEEKEPVPDEWEAYDKAQS